MRAAAVEADRRADHHRRRRHRDAGRHARRQRDRCAAVEQAGAAGAGGAVALVVLLVAGRRAARGDVDIRSAGDALDHRRTAGWKGPGTGLQRRQHLGGRQRRVHGQHQRGGAGHQRRRKARAQGDVVAAVGVDAVKRPERATVAGGQQRVQAGSGQIHAIAGRRTDRDLRAQVRVADLGAGMAHPGHGNHVRATRRGADLDAVIAGGSDDDDATRGDLLEQVHIGLTASGSRTQAQVDDAGRMRIRRHAVDGYVGGPAQRVLNVRIKATAFAEHAHRQQHHLTADARHADAVVRRRTDQARRLGAVPAAVADVARRVAAPDHADVGSGHAVARVGRIGVAAIRVVGRAGVADEVIAAQQLARQVRVVEAHAGVEHRDDDARFAGCDRPRRFGVDGRHDARRVGDDGAGRGAQIPLADGRRGRLTVAIKRVIRRRQRAHAAVNDGVLDVGLRRQPRRQLSRTEPRGVDELAALTKGATVAQPQTEPRRQRLRVLRPVDARRRGA